MMQQEAIIHLSDGSNHIIAGMFGFSVDYYEAPEASRENPDVGDLFGD